MLKKVPFSDAFPAAKSLHKKVRILACQQKDRREETNLEFLSLEVTIGLNSEESLVCEPEFSGEV